MVAEATGKASRTTQQAYLAEEPSAHERSVRPTARRGLLFALLVWFVVRVILSVWGFVVVAASNPVSYRYIFEVHQDVAPPTQDVYGYSVGIWNIYDVRHYVTIAENGYSSNPDWLPAYFPGFPLLILAIGPLFAGDSLLASFVIANLAAIVFFWYLYRLVELDHGEAVARRAVVLSAVFPSAFFLFLGYSEAPLLAFSVAALYYGRQGRWWLAGLLGGAAALTKQPGIFLAPALIYMYWQQCPTRDLRYFIKKLDWLWLLLLPASALGYTLYRYLVIRAPITGVTDVGGEQELAFPGYALVKALSVARLDNPLLPLNLMDIAFTVLVLVLVLGMIAKKGVASYPMYTVPLLLANLSVSMASYYLRPEINMPRRMFLLFPIFIYLAVVTEERHVFKYVVLVSFVLFLILSALFVSWIFVS